MLGTGKTAIAAAVRQVIRLRGYQQEVEAGIYDAWSQGATNVLAVMPTGAGKCLGKGTPVLMYDGSIKAVEDVRPGDKLMGPDSRPRAVLSTCRGREPLYRVRQNKGDDYVVNESHILSLVQTGIKSKPLFPCQSGKGRVKNISVRDYLDASDTFRHVHKGWKAPVTFSSSRLDPDLPPYMLGLWLGDGTSRGPSITTEDPEIADYVKRYAEERGLDFRVEGQPLNSSEVYHVTNGFKRSGSLRAALLRQNLILNKHIPKAYKTGSNRQRRQLLAGIIDSDGARHKTGFEITFKSLSLIQDVVYVARSLGFYAGISEKVVGGVTYYRSHLDGGPRLPLLLDRKQPKPRRQKKNPLVTGITLEPLGEGDYYGFEIDGDRLFMLGDFTVTHNTVMFAKALADTIGASAAIAHRQELVSQISLTLARFGVRHRIIGPKNLVKTCVSMQMDELGESWYHANADCAVAGVDTLVKRKDAYAAWLPTVRRWVIDEAHHVLIENKWGTAAGLFPNAQGLGVTATPVRADGKGLGSHHDGVFDAMVEGPTPRQLIEWGFLTDYTLVASPSDIEMSEEDIGKSGDYSQSKLKAKSRVSHIVGDVVGEYLKYARGKLGVTFVTDTETAADVAAEFNRQGVPAEVVTAKTPDRVRSQIIKRFRRRELLQLVNVDLFGEGFDLPSLEVVSMARPTASFSLYSQQFGRALRPMYPEGWPLDTAEQRLAAIANSVKPRALVIDHVGNWTRHGLPDAPRVWTLDRRDRKKKGQSDAIPCTACPECTAVYERYRTSCPYCGYAPPPEPRSGPEKVDGDLTIVDADIIARLRGEIDRIDGAAQIPQNLPPVAQAGAAKNHKVRQLAQSELRRLISWWAGYRRAEGKSNAEIYRLFYLRFGLDVLSAQALGKAEAEALTQKIREALPDEFDAVGY